MAIIITKNGKGAVKLNKTPFGLEDNLQKYIHNNPESIPLYDIKEDVQLLILSREFSTSSGPIDAIGIDRDGEIYLIETKLYKNPDKRKVVAQVLDYGASLWKTHPNFDSFLMKIDNSVQQTFNQSVRQRMQSFYAIDETEVETLLAGMAENLDEGNFKFVVLMDTISDQLKDLILYMNQNSKFDIYGVELEFYKHNEFEIIIPKLFGAEVKKDIPSKRSDTTFITDDEFVSMYKSFGLENKILEILDIHKSIKEGKLKFTGWAADRTPKNINIFYKSPNRTNMSLGLSIGFNKEKPSSFDFWFYEKDIEEKVLSAIQNILKIKTTPLRPNSIYGVVARWQIKDFDKEKLLVFLKSLS